MRECEADNTERIKTMDKVPIVGDLPLVGQLFRSPAVNRIAHISPLAKTPAQYETMRVKRFMAGSFDYLDNRVPTCLNNSLAHTGQ